MISSYELLMYVQVNKSVLAPQRASSGTYFFFYFLLLTTEDEALSLSRTYDMNTYVSGTHQAISAGHFLIFLFAEYACWAFSDIIICRIRMRGYRNIPPATGKKIIKTHTQVSTVGRCKTFCPAINKHNERHHKANFEHGSPFCRSFSSA